MARWRSVPEDVPARLAEYSASEHGTGEAGVRQWKYEALSWLRAHPGRQLPAGDVVGVLRETIRLLTRA
jgi:hypothetical protein